MGTPGIPFLARSNSRMRSAADRNSGVFSVTPESSSTLTRTWDLLRNSLEYLVTHGSFSTHVDTPSSEKLHSIICGNSDFYFVTQRSSGAYSVIHRAQSVFLATHKSTLPFMETQICTALLFKYSVTHGKSCMISLIHGNSGTQSFKKLKNTFCYSWEFRQQLCYSGNSQAYNPSLTKHAYTHEKILSLMESHEHSPSLIRKLTLIGTQKFTPVLMIDYQVWKLKNTPPLMVESVTHGNSNTLSATQDRFCHSWDLKNSPSFMVDSFMGTEERSVTQGKFFHGNSSIHHHSW